MSMIVARMQKMKAANLIGLGNHNQRRTENHSNEDIDVTRSHLNYDLINKTRQYKTDIETFINENKASSRAVRKDAVLVNEWIITSDSAFFKGLDENQTKRFFQSARNYFSENYGDSNIRYAQVHLDERTPHMHLGIVPFSEDKRLSAKTLFNRQSLLTIQEELPKYLKERGFAIERGQEDSERKHLTVKEYKNLKEKEQELIEQNHVSQSELNKVKSNYSELEGQYRELVVQNIGIKKEVDQKEKELVQFGFRDKKAIEQKPALLKKGYSIVKTSELKQVEKDAGLATLANEKFKNEEIEKIVLERQLKEAEEANKELKEDLGGKLEWTRNQLALTQKKLTKVVNEFADRWDYAKDFFKQAFNKDLDEVYKGFKDDTKQKEAKTTRNDLSR